MYCRTDSILFRFLEQYLRRLEGPLATQVWSRYIQLAKEILGSSRDFKACNFPTLRFEVSAVFSSENLTLCRCLGILADKITQSTSMEDRKIRKELQVCNSIFY
jgi:hypothetical protein